MQKFARFNRAVMALILSLTPVANAAAVSERDQRSVTFVMPEMEDFVSCRRAGCDVGQRPAEAMVPQVYTYTRTSETPAAAAAPVISESVRAESPMSPPEVLQGSVSSGNMSYSLGARSDGITAFLQENAAGLGVGAAGALLYYQGEQAAQERQAAAAAQIDHIYKEGRAINGNYVREAQSSSARSLARAQSIASSTWLQIGNSGAGSSSPANPEAAAKLTVYQRLSQDPFAVRRYVLNDVAQANIAQSIRDSIRAKNYLRAATDFEGLIVNNSSLPPDLQRLANDGLLAFERGDANLPDSPLADAHLQTRKDSDAGQLVRRLANQYQAAWSESDGTRDWNDEHKRQYLTGLIYLQSADQDLAIGSPAGQASLRISNILLQASLGFTQGVINGVKDLEQIIPAAAQLLARYPGLLTGDPATIAEVSFKFLLAAPAMIDAVYTGAQRAVQVLQNGSAFERGQLAGRVAFETALFVATGGPAQVAKSAAALGASVKSISAMTISELSHSTLMQSALIEAAHMPTVLPVGRGVNIYRNFVAAAGEGAAVAMRVEAAQVARAAAVASEGAQDFMRSAVASLLDRPNAVNYLSNAADAERVLKKYAQIETALQKIEAVAVDGYQSRFGPKQFISASAPESVFAEHAGMTTVTGRYGLGGPRGQAVMAAGFGADAEAASAVARAEISSYTPRVENFVEGIMKVHVEKALDLTNPTVLNNLGLTQDALVFNRRINGAFEIPQILGHAAKRAGFDAILAPSAQGGGKVLHHLL